MKRACSFVCGSTLDFVQRLLQSRAERGRRIPRLGHDLDAPVREVCFDRLGEEIIVVANYCDRWCERCALVARCEVGPRNLLPDPRPFDVQVGEALGRAMAMLLAEAARRGVSLDELDEEPFVERPEPVTDLARAWSEQATAWLDQDAVAEPCAPTVRWYSTLVPAKLYRATSAEGSDAPGSAKVATLGLASVAEALTCWLQDHPLDLRAVALLAATCRLVEAVEQRFPGHQSFVRPGFDERCDPAEGT